MPRILSFKSEFGSSGFIGLNSNSPVATLWHILITSSNVACRQPSGLLVVRSILKTANSSWFNPELSNSELSLLLSVLLILSFMSWWFECCRFGCRCRNCLARYLPAPGRRRLFSVRRRRLESTRNPPRMRTHCFFSGLFFCRSCRCGCGLSVN